MGKTKKASKVAAPPTSPPASGSEDETGASGTSSMEVRSPSEFDSDQPSSSTVNANRKRPAPKYKNAGLTVAPGRVVKKLREVTLAKKVQKG